MFWGYVREVDAIEAEEQLKLHSVLIAAGQRAMKDEDLRNWRRQLEHVAEIERPRAPRPSLDELQGIAKGMQVIVDA